MIPLEVVHEDDRLLVLNKRPGQHVNETDTSSELSLVEQLRAEGRDGFIVHRLDKETSGLIALAKDRATARDLSLEFAERRVEKRYWALASVPGDPPPDQVIDAPIGPDKRRPRARRVASGGKPAETAIRVVSARDDVAVVEARPRTGRTHQIRIHLAHVGAPLLGDRLYGGPLAVRLGAEVVDVPRVMLHAQALAFSLAGAAHSFILEAPEDFLAFARRGLVLPPVSA